MSELRERARAIKAAGEEARGEFTPTGAPLKVYSYWAKRSRHAPDRENFCHFWRVVMFWAPLMALRNGVVNVATHPVSVILGILVTLAMIAYVLLTVDSAIMAVLGGLLIILGFVLAGLGLISGVSLALDNDYTRGEYDLPPFKFALPLTILGAPLGLPAFLIARAVRFYGDHLTKWDKQIGLGALAMMFIAFFTFIGFAAGIGTLVVALAIVLGFVGIVIGGAIGLDALSTRVAGKRKVREQEAREALFVYMAEHDGELPPEPEQRLSNFEYKMLAFFKGVGDFAILFGQVIRVNKWKICPTVDISRVEENA